MKDTYPRLLLVTSCAFNSLSGGGITFTNLFKGWPRDRIAAVHEDPITPSTEICERYYKLGQKEFVYEYPFQFLQKQKTSKAQAASETVPSGSTFMSRIKKLVMPLLVGAEIPTRAVLSKELESWITNFRPDVIYTILGSLPFIRLVRAVAERFRIPVVIHMMDDWPSTRYGRGLLGRSRARQTTRELQELIDGSSACLGISQAMCDEFSLRYGKKFQPFHNALCADEWLRHSRTQWKGGRPFVMLYAGALMANSQLESVRDCALAVSRMARSGESIEFKIFAPWYAAQKYRTYLEVSPAVKVLDAPESDTAMREAFVKADLLLLPVNFDADTVRYVRYSMPTKIPAYMFSGTPTLAYGSGEVASIRYAREWALCVTERNQNQLQEAIRILIQDESKRKHFALLGQHLARQRHDAAVVRRKFQNVLFAAANYA